MTRTFKTLFLILTVAALSGCATRWVVDSEVRSHSALQGFAPGATYRFERLPSQQAGDAARAAQADLEAMAAPALDAVGLRRDDAAPRYSVQTSARVNREYSPWADPWFDGPWGPRWGWHAGLGWGPGWYGSGWYGYPRGPVAQPWYMREVSVVMRQLPGNEIVYETQARHDGPYNRSHDLFPVMFRAALQGFPQPPAGTRRVDIELGDEAPAARP